MTVTRTTYLYKKVGIYKNDRLVQEYKVYSHKDNKFVQGNMVESHEDNRLYKETRLKVTRTTN